jgi:hypothetical protein
MDYAARFGSLVKTYMAGLEYRVVARQISVSFATLYDWARGNPPAESGSIRTLAKFLELTKEQEEELVECARLAKKQAEAGRLVSQLTSLAANDPEALGYEADLEGLQVWGAEGFDIPPDDRTELERIVRFTRQQQLRRRGIE